VAWRLRRIAAKQGACVDGMGSPVGAVATGAVISVSVLLTLSVGLLDLTTGYEWTLSILYIFPIAIATWYAGRWFGLSISLLSGVAWLVVDKASGHVYSLAVISYWNATVRLGFFVIISTLLEQMHVVLRQQRELAQRDGLTGLLNARAFRERCRDTCCAVEEGLLQNSKVWQIGLRGSGYSAEDFDWPRQQGFTIVPAHEVWYQSLAPLMTQIRTTIGGEIPDYLSFDIDGVDPSFAGGTGTPEIGGLTVPQALEIVRGCRGLNLVGCDLVEVSPAYDTSGNTALLGANLLFEMLCVLPGVAYR
jgi:hypothetical protein